MVGLFEHGVAVLAEAAHVVGFAEVAQTEDFGDRDAFGAGQTGMALTAITGDHLKRVIEAIADCRQHRGFASHGCRQSHEGALQFGHVGRANTQRLDCRMIEQKRIGIG